MSNHKTLRLSHTLDAAWIITLWKAIHGGDPSPEQITLEAIAALSGALTENGAESVSESSFSELQTRLREIGIEAERKTEAETLAGVSHKAPGPDLVCVKVGRTTVCTPLRRPVNPREQWPAIDGVK